MSVSLDLAAISSGKLVFLFGAGVSLPANLPGIAKMTTEFFSTHISSDSQLKPLKDNILRLWEVTKQDFEHYADLESFMTILMELQDERHGKAIMYRYDIRDINYEEIATIRLGTQNFIRNKLETINSKSVEYLAPLFGFLVLNSTISIFPLNYDGVVEVLTESHGYKYTDGFDPLWNTQSFEDPNVRIKIYKIHGSLYWFRSQTGKAMKIPIKGASIGKIRYMSDDALSEMIIYPTLQKDKYFHIYTWLFNRFITELNEARFCIIVGYSLRDKDIRDNIQDALQSNKDLWLIIVNPNASKYKAQYFEDLDISSKIVTMDNPVEEAISGRLLHKLVQELTIARKEEEDCWNKQFINTEEIAEWDNVFFKYKEINHDDRPKYIAENLLRYEFSPRRPTLPIKLGEKSLNYISNYYAKGDWEKCVAWCKVLVEFYIVSEYAFFSNSGSLKHQNPVRIEEVLPHLRGNADTKDHFSWSTLRSHASKFLSFVKEDQKIKNCAQKLLESINALNFATDDYGRIMEDRISQFIIMYENDLGLLKWSRELCSQLLLKANN